jgi:hypothetical protein
LSIPQKRVKLRLGLPLAFALSGGRQKRLDFAPIARNDGGRTEVAASGEKLEFDPCLPSEPLNCSPWNVWIVLGVEHEDL